MGPWHRNSTKPESMIVSARRRKNQYDARALPLWRVLRLGFELQENRTVRVGCRGNLRAVGQHRHVFAHRMKISLDVEDKFFVTPHNCNWDHLAGCNVK